ncbi:MAG: hypothetical protein NTZ05_16660 [Chloroflexi bacterium]|nr:hypothetical protein [Chloroflexota bacterium]
MQSSDRRIYTVAAVPPEVQAYAMAKYSRSAQGMAESIGKLSVQRTEEFWKRKGAASEGVGRRAKVRTDRVRRRQ